ALFQSPHAHALSDLLVTCCYSSRSRHVSTLPPSRQRDVRSLTPVITDLTCAVPHSGTANSAQFQRAIHCLGLIVMRSPPNSVWNASACAGSLKQKRI